MSNPVHENVPFATILDAILDTSSPFPPYYLHRFSDLSRSDLSEVKKIWNLIDANRKVNFLEDLEQLLEADTLVCFDDLAILALDDSLDTVRQLGIRLLWYTEDKKLIQKFTHLLMDDPSVQVRETAASILGQFVYLGEIETIPSQVITPVIDQLLQVVNGKDGKQVRQNALMSLGYSSREEIPALIKNAFSSKDISWVASALSAMGRSADEKWEKSILSTLDHPDDNVRYAAVQAAGEIPLQTARQPLLNLISEEDEEVSDDVRLAAIWSLSQIGGEGVRDLLEKLLENSGEDEEGDLIEEALENLSFTEDLDDLSLIDLDIDEENDPIAKNHPKKKSR